MLSRLKKRWGMSFFTNPFIITIQIFCAKVYLIVSTNVSICLYEKMAPQISDIFYPASVGLSLAWPLAFTKSFALLVIRVQLVYYANDKRRERLCQRLKPCKRETSARRPIIFSLIKGSPNPLQQIWKNIKKDRRVKNRFKLIAQVNLYSNFIFQLSVSQTFGGVFTRKTIINATW